jgi:hypothetical protein
MATSQLNLLGFLFFTQFIIHTFAYYSCRLIDAPIDFFLISKRGLKLDCRQFFTYCFLLVSSIALVAILAMKIALHLSGQDDNAFDTETTTDSGEEATDLLSFLKQLIPDYDSMYTLMSTCLAVLFAAILTQTRKSEIAELQHLEQKTREATEGCAFDEGQDKNGPLNEARSNASSSGHLAEEISSESKKQALKKASRIIQDYNFKHNVLAGLSFLTLGVVSASTITLANAPYQLLFVLQAFMNGLNWETCNLNYQRYLGKVLTFLLVAELIG